MHLFPIANYVSALCVLASSVAHFLHAAEVNKYKHGFPAKYASWVWLTPTLSSVFVHLTLCITSLANEVTGYAWWFALLLWMAHGFVLFLTFVLYVDHADHEIRYARRRAERLAGTPS